MFSLQDMGAASRLRTDRLLDKRCRDQLNQTKVIASLDRKEGNTIGIQIQSAYLETETAESRAGDYVLCFVIVDEVQSSTRSPAV